MMDRLLREGNPPVSQLASPVPQYKDVQTNDWEELKGEGGASYVKDKDALAKLDQARLLLASIDGKDFATDAKLGDLRTLLGSLDGKDFATQTTLAQVKTELDLVKTELEQARVLLNAISNKDFATQATLEVVQSELALIKSELDNIKQNQTSGDQKVQLSGTLTELFGESLSDRPPANSVSVGTTFMVVGDTVVYQSNGKDWVVISE